MRQTSCVLHVVTVFILFCSYGFIRNDVWNGWKIKKIKRKEDKRHHVSIKGMSLYKRKLP